MQSYLGFLHFQICFSQIWLVILPPSSHLSLTVEMEMNKHKNVMKPRMPRTVLLSFFFFNLF